MKLRKTDLVAGVSVSGLMLPEAVAYAAIAGLPPQRALFAAIAGSLAYGVLGRSRFAIVSPTSSSAAILAATLVAVPVSAGEKSMLVTIVVGLVGLVFLAAWLMRLGNLAGIISRPVLRGFSFGLAVTIILKQIPVLVGAPSTPYDIFHQLVSLMTSISSWHVPTLSVGIAALIALLLLRGSPSIPAAFCVLAAGVCVSWFFQLSTHGVAVVGSIQLMSTWPDVTAARWTDISRLLPYVPALVLILFAESWGTIRSLSLRHGESVAANRELGALGLANLLSALAQGMPVGAGFSAGSAAEAAGATSRLTAVVAAFGLTILILFGRDFVALLPQSVLAAVVIAALTHALNPTPLLRLWKLRRDAYVAIAAAVGVMAFGVLDGILLAVLISVAALLRRLASSNSVRLGRLMDSHDFVDIAKHPDAIPINGIGIWRPTQPLFFANADAMLSKISEGAASDRTIQAVVVSLEESFDLDSTAFDAVLEFDAIMRKSGKSVRYARVHDRIRELFAASDKGLSDRCSFSVDDAVASLNSSHLSNFGKTS